MKSKKFLSLILVLPLLLAPRFSTEASWKPDTRITFNTGRSGLSAGNARCIVVDSVGSVHMVWHDDTPGNHEIQYLSFDSLSALPAEAKRVTTNPGISRDPSIALLSDGSVFVVWEDDSETPVPSILFARFVPDADTFLDYGVVSTGEFACAGPCAASASDGSVHAVWSEDSGGNFDIFYRKWDQDWVEAPLNLTSNSGTCVNASVASDGAGNVHVVWADNLTDNYEIYHKSYTSGLGWSAPFQVSRSSRLAWSPSVSVDEEGNVYVVWADERDWSFEIYLRRYLHEVGWGYEKRVTYNGAISANPSVAVDCYGNMHIVWEDFRDGNDEIYYRKITNNDGPGWDPVETRLTDEWSTSWNASVAADSTGKVHVIWSDNRDLNFEIYYKLGINPVPVGIELSCFYAECSREGVILRWDVSSDSPTAFLDVYRREKGESSLVKLTEMSLLGQKEFLDTKVNNGVTYEYFLGILEGGTEDERLLFGPLCVTYLPPSTVAAPVMTVWPNPTTGPLNILFAAEGQNVPFQLSLLDVCGRTVRVIASGKASSGATSIFYNTAGLSDQRLSSGVYFVSLEIDSRRLERKIVMLK